MTRELQLRCGLAPLLLFSLACAATVGGRTLAQYGDEAEDGLYGEPVEMEEYNEPIGIPEFDMDMFGMEESEMEDDEPGAPDGTSGCADGTVTCKEGSFCDFGNTCSRLPSEGEPCIPSRVGLGLCGPGLECVDVSGQQAVDEFGFIDGGVDLSLTECQVLTE